MSHGRDVHQIIGLENNQFRVYHPTLFTRTHQIQLGILIEESLQIGPVKIVRQVPIRITYFLESAVVGFLCPDIDKLIIPTLHDAPHAVAHQHRSV